MSQLAEDTSVLLELFSRIVPDNVRDIDDEQRNMIASAAQNISKLQISIGLVSAPESGSLNGQVDTNIDAACVICYSEIADTVFRPCNHLAICGVSTWVLRWGIR